MAFDRTMSTLALDLAGNFEPGIAALSGLAGAIYTAAVG
jgi:hypothetical protein